LPACQIEAANLFQQHRDVAAIGKDPSNRLRNFRR
jgi:hypothetical protein